jgi:hypothetical protein
MRILLCGIFAVPGLGDDKDEAPTDDAAPPGRGCTTGSRAHHLGRRAERTAELIRSKGPWKSIDDLEIAVAEHIGCFNHQRLHGEIGLVSPAELEDTCYRQNTAEASAASHRTRGETLGNRRRECPSKRRGRSCRGR